MGESPGATSESLKQLSGMGAPAHSSNKGISRRGCFEMEKPRAVGTGACREDSGHSRKPQRSVPLGKLADRHLPSSPVLPCRPEGGPRLSSQCVDAPQSQLLTAQQPGMDRAPPLPLPPGLTPILVTMTEDKLLPCGVS